MQQVSKLFELKDGQFQFDNKVPLPNAEMTGLNAQPKQVTLAGLRVLRDWRMLQDKLPDATSGLISAVAGKPQLSLNQLEWQVWEFANGSVPIQEIAKQLQLPIEKIQQVVFRLMIVGLIEEVPLLIETPIRQPQLEMPMMVTEDQTNPVQQTSVSQSFLQNLVGFLKVKT